MACSIYRSPWVVAVVLLCAACTLVTSCAADSRVVANAGQPLGPGGALALPDPAGLATRLASAETLLRLGSGFETVLLQPCRVVADGDDGLFDPNWDPGSPINQAAYALYTFNVPETAGNLTLLTRWNSVPEEGELWIGAANFTRGAWDWHTFTRVPPNIALTALLDSAAHRTPSGDALIVVLTVGHAMRRLELIDLGASEPVISGVSPIAGQPGELLTIGATVTGSAPLSYAWDFGGGATPDTSSETSPSITLGEMGAYPATLTVTNPLGSDTFDFQLGVGVPIVTGISPRLGYRGPATAFSATVVAPGDYTLSWNFNGIATPGVSPELSPTVNLTGLGNMRVDVTATNANGSAHFDFPLTILPDPASLPVDSLIAMPLDTMVALGEPLRVVVMMGATTHPFQFLDAVGVRVDTAAEFVRMSMDYGVPDDTPDFFAGGFLPVPVDGFWEIMNPTDFVPTLDDFILTYDLADGTEYTMFNITPYGGSDMIGSAGALFSFSLRFNTPGSYPLQFIEHDAVRSVDTTKYSDLMGNVYVWADISNSIEGIPHTVEVVAP